MNKTISSDDTLEKLRDVITTHNIEATELLELIEIYVIARKELKDKVRGGINAVLAGSDRNEVVNEVVEYVLNNYASNKMVNYLESRKDTKND